MKLSAWRAYYLDPRVAMRSASPPSEVTDIGPLGEAIAPYLFRLKMEKRRCFEAVRRALQTVIPSVRGLDVDLNKFFVSMIITQEIKNGSRDPDDIPDYLA